MEIKRWKSKAPATEADIKDDIRERGLIAMRWEGDPGQSWTPHSHGKTKTLWCAAGDIVFHLNEQDVHLKAGDSMLLPAGIVHAADAGSGGVVCYESPPMHENTKFEENIIK